VITMAIHHDVVIDGRKYRVSEDVGLERVKTKLLAAARSGGAFVTLSGGAAGSLDVMITACTPIRIEHTTGPADRLAEEPAEPVADNPDWWF
jgi:hypothetical protein